MQHGATSTQIYRDNRLTKRPSIFQDKDFAVSSAMQRIKTKLVVLKGLKPRVFLVVNNKDAVKLMLKGYTVIAKNY